MKNGITFIVCTKNAIDTIERCLESIKNYPVILVDKDSNDGTLEIASKYKNVKIIKQVGNGLANARNIGLEKVKTKYICMFGSDNILKERLDQTDIEYLYYHFNDKEWVGVGLRTSIYNPKTYFDRCMGIWFYHKIKQGIRKVVGTPVIYKTEVLKKFGYDEKHTHSDDTELSEKLFNNGYKQGYSSYYCYDISVNNFKTILDRFKRYGISDKEYHKKYCKTIKSKIKSYFHTLTSDFVPNIYFIPFWFMIMIIRFYGRTK